MHYIYDFLRLQPTDFEKAANVTLAYHYVSGTGASIESSSSYDGDGNENVTKQ